MPPSVEATEALYDRTAHRWVRRAPSSLSDFTAREPVLEICEPVAGARILDIGCGEGYCARELRRRGAGPIDGLDVAANMIAAARYQEDNEPLGIEYHHGDATDLSRFADASCDLALAMFLFNYMGTEDTRRCMAEVYRVLRPGGRFVFAVPHPTFPYMRPAGPPFFFRVGGAGYFSARDAKFPGRIWKIDGTYLEVQLIHKTLEDYFEALNAAGFSTMPRLRELRVTAAHVEMHPTFFGPLVDTPLHLAFEVKR
jgi:ubiquinone/menaquinone biosynthesis C-methylase UbiE